MDGVFEALGDAVRRSVLELLAAGEQPVSAIVVALRPVAAISQSAVSQHLKVLRDAGLVVVRAEGKQRFHALDQAGLEAARAWLTALTELADPLAPFTQPLDALATEVARGRRKTATGGSARPGQAGRRPA